MTKELLSQSLSARCNGSVGIVTGLGVDDQGIGVFYLGLQVEYRPLELI